MVLFRVGGGRARQRFGGILGQRLDTRLSRLLLDERALTVDALEEAVQHQVVHGGALDTILLDPRRCWPDPAAYDREAQRLLEMFTENYRKFEAAASSHRAAAE